MSSILQTKHVNIFEKLEESSIKLVCDFLNDNETNHFSKIDKYLKEKIENAFSQLFINEHRIISSFLSCRFKQRLVKELDLFFLDDDTCYNRLFPVSQNILDASGSKKLLYPVSEEIEDNRLFPNLEKVTLTMKQISRENLSRLNRYSIKELTFCSCTLQKEALKVLFTLPHLQSLTFHMSTYLTDQVLKQISNNLSLKKLCIRFALNITFEGLKHLANLKELDELDIDHCPNITSVQLQDIYSTLFPGRFIPVKHKSSFCCTIM